MDMASVDNLVRRGIDSNGYANRAKKQSKNMNTNCISAADTGINGMDDNNGGKGDNCALRTGKVSNKEQTKSRKRAILPTSGCYGKKKSAVSLRFNSPCSTLDLNS